MAGLSVTSKPIVKDIIVVTNPTGPVLNQDWKGKNSNTTFLSLLGEALTLCGQIFV
jgi:hypothetical protein